MLRYLTSVPPGKVRFTIVDPVGLGENFAAFMHLGDYHELLVTNRIWTEAQHIEQRLTDLTEHMENVIQKYLRNEFETIEEYNTMAGEVAEPFRVLVVANFPTNFNDAALRRLISIVNSGARCGVYALVHVRYEARPAVRLPAQGAREPLRQHDLEGGPAAVAGAQFRPVSPGSRRAPRSRRVSPSCCTRSATPPATPTASRCRSTFIAPKPDEYWSFDSSKGVDIPLGRAGATKLQHLKLGKGTSQHVLTAGKTGSGKSTLLHALITNGALRYSPDQLELYLIDFKKGVEFKVYAAMDLPHARVIAVESEREFGLSVLQRLDVELKERGEIYRELGCQDLAGYREARPEVPMPRILLIVDEFQEFFVEDDKIAQEVTLLLDRLVRQGRAFGMHVILGSQTLGGQYSLPKATLGQMAVRIALQCSEADAHLILSEDNTAARLLTRPGEAIYNDANGMMEGNNLFQVVWLPDANRESYLERIQEMSREHNIQKPPPIVFEGNLPADVHKNPLLNQLLEATEWPEAPRADYAWLGDAIAIKDPTAIVFRPQSGSNVLIVGQNDEAALAMMIMAALGIAAQHPPAGPQACRFYLLDGSPVDSALSGQLGRLKDVLPHPVTNVTWRDLATTFAEPGRGSQAPAGSRRPTIRRRSISSSTTSSGSATCASRTTISATTRYDEDKPAPPSKLFGDVLRDGPPVGIHTIIWCDSVNNMNRTFDRQGMKEFENRILFQMSANDSSTLIDTPAASKLGENRALYYSEEENRIEKFRPYGVPELGMAGRRESGGSRPARDPRSTVSRLRAAMALRRRSNRTRRPRRPATGRMATANSAAPAVESHRRTAPVDEPWSIHPSRPCEPEPPGPAPCPPITSRVAARSPRRSQLAPQRLGRDVHAPHLDLQRADLVLGDQPFQSLEVQRRTHPAPRKAARNGVETRSVAGQVIDTVGDPAQSMFQGEPVEQAGAEQGGVGIEDQASRAGTRAPIADVGPSRSVQVTFSGSRVARRRHETSSPNQTVASLHSPRRLISSTSYSGPGKCLAKSLAGPSLMAPAATRRAADFQKPGPGA